MEILIQILLYYVVGVLVTATVTGLISTVEVIWGKKSGVDMDDVEQIFGGSLADSILWPLRICGAVVMIAITLGALLGSCIGHGALFVRSKKVNR